MPSDNKANLRILLMQIRDQARVRVEEFESFVNFSGLQESQITVLNVFDTPVFGSEVLEGYDALFVGGASEASVLEPENYPFVQPSINLLQHCIDVGLPVFASCFGFQLAALALKPLGLAGPAPSCAGEPSQPSARRGPGDRHKAKWLARQAEAHRAAGDLPAGWWL